jgi:hypothetical protein
MLRDDVYDVCHLGSNLIAATLKVYYDKLVVFTLWSLQGGG